MKAVLLSTRPKWCEKICHEIGTDENGKPIYEKEIEVRKTKPSIPTPFKVYIYKTKKKKWLDICHVGEVNWIGVTADKTRILKGVEKYGGKVIGEFICDKVDEYHYGGELGYLFPSKTEWVNTCLSCKEIEEYGKGKTLYGWHISDLKIYDKPKELSDFKVSCKGCKDRDTYHCKFYCHGDREITCPPQSWCYVEELEE